MFKLRKLNARGVAHHAVLMLIVVCSIAGFGAWAVTASHADSTYTQTLPNGCLPGQQPNVNAKGKPTGGCGWKNSQTQLLQDCTDYHLQTDLASKNPSVYHCQYNCIAGWHINAGTCIQNASGNPGGGGGTGSGGGSSGGGSSGGGSSGGGQNTPPTDAQCAKIFRLNNDKTNNHCDACVSGYVDGDGKSFTYDDSCKPTAATVPPPATGGNHGIPTPPTVTDAAAQALCTQKHMQWHSASKVCGPDCATNAGLAEGQCVVGVTTITHSTPAKCNDVTTPDGACVKLSNIEKYCKSRNFKLSDNKKNCSKDCVSKDYVFDSNTVTCNPKATGGTPAPQSITVDTSVHKDICAALGRQWRPSVVLQDGTTGKGCDVNTCDIKDVAMILQPNGGQYCYGYITKISNQNCADRHRVWVEIADGCASNHQKKEPGQVLRKNDACLSPYTTYVFRAGEDECMKPTAAQAVQSAAQTVTHPVVAAANATKAQICRLRPHMEWDGHKCIKKNSNGTSSNSGDGSNGPVNTPQNDPTPPATGLAPNGKGWDSYCAGLNRKSTTNAAGHKVCASGCKSSDYIRYGADKYGTPQCALKKNICEQGGGTKICGVAHINGDACPAGQHLVDSTGASHCVNDACPVGQHLVDSTGASHCVADSTDVTSHDPTPSVPNYTIQHLSCTDFYNKYMKSRFSSSICDFTVGSDSLLHCTNSSTGKAPSQTTHVIGSTQYTAANCSGLATI